MGSSKPCLVWHGTLDFYIEMTFLQLPLFFFQPVDWDGVRATAFNSHLTKLRAVLYEARSLVYHLNNNSDLHSLRPCLHAIVSTSMSQIPRPTLCLVISVPITGSEYAL